MALKEKIEAKEKIVKMQIENLRAVLNIASKFNKENPNDWKYLTMLSNCENSLRILNDDLGVISNNSQ